MDKVFVVQPPKGVFLSPKQRNKLLIHVTRTNPQCSTQNERKEYQSLILYDSVYMTFLKDKMLVMKTRLSRCQVTTKDNEREFLVTVKYLCHLIVRVNI